ncbi:glycosyltransferase family 32 protein [Butyriboletus roseoflavus]|nr:glycosyltransferase family 32 protein [Butyriboletus roseoflavus]
MSSVPYGVLPTHDNHDSSDRRHSNPFLARIPLPPLRRWWLRRSTSSHTHPGVKMRPRTLLNILKFVLPIALLALWWVWHTFEPHLHIDLVFYDRNWIANEIHPITPLSGCFNPDRVSPLYNVTEELYGKKRFEVQAGIPMRMGMDCYAFAGTVLSPDHDAHQDAWIPPEHRNQYHTYWRTDLVPLGERQEFMLKSFFATQNLPRARLVLWSNGDLTQNPIVQRYLQRFPESFSLNIVDIPALAKGTAMETSKLLQLNDKKAWVDGDLVRLLVIWHYGGMWIDMDMLVTRDLEPLLEHEFVTQWDCWAKTYQALNGALMHFKQQSPYLCEAFHLMATSTPPRSPSTDWGAILYLRLWRRLLAESIPPFKILPSCFSDPIACRRDNSVPDPFTPDRADGHVGEWIWTGRRRRARPRAATDIYGAFA